MSSSTAKGKAPSAAETPYELPWCSVIIVNLSAMFIFSCRVEKYRPTVLDDVVGNSDTIERLKVIARDGNCPHIIISV